MTDTKQLFVFSHPPSGDRDQNLYTRFKFDAANMQTTSATAKRYRNLTNDYKLVKKNFSERVKNNRADETAARSVIPASPVAGRFYHG